MVACALMQGSPEKFHERCRRLVRSGKSNLTGFAIAGVIGLAAALYLGWSESSRQHERILLAVSDIAQQMDVTDLRRLKGDSTDLESPQYLHMKAHLMAQRANVKQMRFLYLMRRDGDGRVRFLCDSEEAGSKDESPPGQEYPEISPVLLAAFDSPSPVLDGPNTDRWGTWISGVQPIRDPSDGRVMAVLGMDFSARDVQRSVLFARLRGAALGLLLAMGWAAMMFFRRRWRKALEEDPPRYPPSLLLRLGPGVVVTAMGLASTLGAFIEADRRATDTFEKSLRHEAGIRVDALRNGVQQARQSMELLAHHLEAAQSTVQPEGWWLMANHMLDLEGAQSVCWVPLVRETDLPVFLTALSRLENRKIELFEIRNGRRAKARSHEIHYPIALAVPRERQSELLGWDLATQDGPRKAFEMARSEGRTFLTEPSAGHDGRTTVQLVSTAFNPALPLRTRQDREDAIKGYALVTLEIGHFLETRLRSTPSMGLDLSVEDLQAPANEARVLLSRSADTSALRDSTKGWSYTYVMDAGGRPWKITVTPTNVFLTRFFDHQHFWILPIGLLVSLLVAQMVSWLYGQRLRSEILVIHRTRDLRESNACTMSALAEVARQREAVHRSEQRLVLTLDVVGEGLCEIDLSARTISHNKVWSRILGQPEDHELSHPLESFISTLPQDEATLVAEGLEEARNEPGPFFLEFRIHRPDGERWVQMKGRFLSEDHGGKETILATISDVTERRAASDRLLEMNRELGRSRLEAQRLATEAQQASRSKSQFLANMSHEIRTPMNGILGMIGLLLETALSDEQRRFAKIVRASAESLLSIINDILDFSKIESGKLELERIPFDLRSTLDDVASTLALHAQEKGIEFVCAADPDVPERIEGDPVRLRQILLNLAGNAVKFTASGEVSVRVSVESRLGEELRLMFSVRDTGIGIPPSKQGELFKSFSQVDASTSRKFGGTGLGLAISKQLSEMMGGRIGLDSEPGKGSTFWFSIATRELEPAGTWDGKSLLEGRHILVVDDSATNREILLWQFAAWGATVATAASGREALEQLDTTRTENVHFDAAILDMKMPNMDGVELAGIIHEREDLKDLPILLMTSLAATESSQRLSEAGIRLRLSKPVRSSDLREALSVLLGGESRQALEPPQRTTGPMVRRRILVAEDNAINQLVAQGILSSLGYDVHLVSNGLLAVQALESEDFDLVLMDCQMPELNGFDATRMIRSADSRALDPKIPIVALTANAMDDDRELCLECGMDDYLAKPFAPEALDAMLARWLPPAP
jgi:PAS domain S-box-containing protein